MTFKPFFDSSPNPNPRAAIIRIPLDLTNVRVLDTYINEQYEFVITIESATEGTICRCCKKEINKFHGHDGEITRRHLSIFGEPVYIRWRPKRYRCPDCSAKKGKQVTTSQIFPWQIINSPHTPVYKVTLVKDDDLSASDADLLARVFTPNAKSSTAKNIPPAASGFIAKRAVSVSTPRMFGVGRVLPSRIGMSPVRAVRCSVRLFPFGVFTYSPDLKKARDFRDELTAFFENIIKMLLII